MSYTAEGIRCEMQEKVRDVVGLAADDSRKAALAFAARVLNLPFDRVRRLFYGQARRIEAHEADQIRAYVEAATKLIEARADYERQRRAFLAEAHPALVRLAPREIVAEEVSETVSESTVARGRR